MFFGNSFICVLRIDQICSPPPLLFSQGVDYEKNKIVNLEIMARNEAELMGTTAQWNTIIVKVAVGDVDEGPEFTAPTVRFHVKENTANGTVIGTYTAIDPETKSSNGIRLASIFHVFQRLTCETSG